MNRPIHILRYGTVAEKVHLEKAISAYDYLSINGNTAAYVSAAIAKFIVEKFFSDEKKGFFIDPITYAFQNEIGLLMSKSKTTGEEKIKKSVEKLIDIYNGPVVKVRDGMAISPEDFSKNSDRESFSNRILDFQYNLVYQHIEKNDLKKYLDYVIADNIPQLRPKFLIAPYFYLNAQDVAFEKWLEINTSFVNIAVSQANNKFNHTDVFAQIVINKNVLYDAEKFWRLIEAYKELPCTGYTIWIDDLNEHEATVAELKEFMSLLKALKGKPIYNMYGGYFSILLTHKSLGLLNGVSHGLEYGESRKVYPIGGGIPVSKYYYFPLHRRLDFTKAFYMLEHIKAIDIKEENWGSSEKYYSEICKCEQCRRILGANMINFVEFESRDFYEVHRKSQILRRKKASSDTKQNCLYHYLLCKKVEFSKVRKESLDSLVEDLAKQKERYEAAEAIHESELSFIEVWVKCLRE